MAANEIHLYDYGTVFEATVYDSSGILDISSASVHNFEFLKPSRTGASVSASFSASSGTDGKLRWASTSMFLDEVGDWQWQVYLDMTTGTWHSDIQQFRVHRNI